MTQKDDDIEALLALRELEPPAQFTANVMSSAVLEVNQSTNSGFSFPDVMQWLALGDGRNLRNGAISIFLIWCLVRDSDRVVHTQHI